MSVSEEDGRIERRRHLHYYAKVLNRDNGELLGRVADISLSGVMLIRAEMVDPGKIFAMRIVLPDAFEEGGHIDFEAVSRWCRKDINPDYHVTGFEITHIDSKNERAIISLIKACSFDD